MKSHFRFLIAFAAVVALSIPTIGPQAAKAQTPAASVASPAAQHSSRGAGQVVRLSRTRSRSSRFAITPRCDCTH